MGIMGWAMGHRNGELHPRGKTEVNLQTEKYSELLGLHPRAAHFLSDLHIIASPSCSGSSCPSQESPSVVADEDVLSCPAYSTTCVYEYLLFNLII